VTCQRLRQAGTPSTTHATMSTSHGWTFGGCVAAVSRPRAYSGPAWHPACRCPAAVTCALCRARLYASALAGATVQGRREQRDARGPGQLRGGALGLPLSRRCVRGSGHSPRRQRADRPRRPAGGTGAIGTAGEACAHRVAASPAMPSSEDDEHRSWTWALRWRSWLRMVAHGSRRPHRAAAGMRVEPGPSGQIARPKWPRWPEQTRAGGSPRMGR
jgi:hypothetical protein